MEYELEVTTEPTEPLTVEEAKLHLRVDHDDEDDYIAVLIAVAREQAEEVYLWRSCSERSYRVTLDGVAGEVLLPMGPVTVVTKAEALVNGEWAEMAESEYYLDWGPSGRVRVTVPDGAERLRFEYDAGPESTPQHVKQACLLMIGHWYEQRQAVEIRPGAGAIEVPLGVQALLLSRRAW